MGKDAFIWRKMPYSLRNRTPGNPCPRTILTAIPLFHSTVQDKNLCIILNNI